MDLGIAGRKAIVCASSRGLGRACAMSLAQAGCEVVVKSLKAVGCRPILITVPPGEESKTIRRAEAICDRMIDAGERVVAPGFAVLISGENNPEGGKSCWSSGFLPTTYQGVEFRSKGDPVLFVSNPAGKAPQT